MEIRTDLLKQLTSSEIFVLLIDSLRRDGCVLDDVGYHEIATTIADGLDSIGDHSQLDADDADTVARAFESIAETLGA